MKKLLFYFLFCLCFPLCMTAQTSRVYGDESFFLEQENKQKISSKHFEISAGTFVSYGKIADTAGHRLSDRMYGQSLRADIHIWDTIWLGGEAVHFNTASLHNDFIPELSRKAWVGFVKWYLTRNTEPRIYLLAGRGEVYQESEFVPRKVNYKGHGALWLGGIGGEVRIWKGLSLTGEGRVTYEEKPFKNIWMKNPHCRTELKLGLSYFL